MFRKSVVRIVALTATMAVLAVGAVATVSAAPAESFSTRECYPDQWGEVAGTICYTIHNVEKSGANGKSAVSQSKENGSMLIEFFDANGGLVFSDKTVWHRTAIEKDGVTQVYHDKVRVTGYFEGQTCTAEMNVVFANGQVRHLGPEWQLDCK